MRGDLHLVVGPSGAGKDTLIAAAAKARPDLHVVERVITRAAEAGGEPHRAVEAEEFDRLEREGAFALSWRAHGHGYGVPMAAIEALKTPRHALTNVSRSVIPEARSRFGPLRILLVTASPAALARRLTSRGRESEAEIAERLARAAPVAVEGPDVWVIDNDADPATGAARFLAALAPPLNPSADSA